MAGDGKLLIVGGESDPNTQRVVDQAHIRQLDYLFWDTDQPGSHHIAWDFNSPQLHLGDHRLVPHAIFARCNVFGRATAATNQIHDLIQAYALAWPPVGILNRRSLANRNVKSHNLRLAAELGLPTPQTRVLGDLCPLATIPNPEKWIVKPLNGGAHTVPVSELSEMPPAKLAASGPHFIQQRLDGENLRVFVIGGATFCFRLKTSQLDYREDPDVDVIEMETPESIEALSVTLATNIGFDYCALDFRCVSGLNQPTFLEINSFPMFVRFDDASRNRLVDAILNFLQG